MTFLKDFVNVLSGSSISFLLLSSVFGFIVFFNLLDGRLKSKGGYGFIALGAILLVAGIFIRPLLYLGIAYFLIMFGCAALGGRLWDTKVGLRLFLGAVVAFFLSFLDPNFFAIAAKPDNVPIGAMIFLLGIFTWIALRKAYLNDKQIEVGGIPFEKTETDEKLFTWPDLVYTEMLCMILLTIVMVVWSVVLRAPLEEAANPTSSPNPAKAPWYFLGLQEMLVYYDPWMAGVVLPTFIIIGLIALPYIDFNQKGNGYYTFSQRPFAIITFMFGFIVLWVTLIVLGTILRGPNWNFFGPFTYWDPHKVDPLNNVNISQIFWLNWLGKPLEGMNPVVRELPGFILIFIYLFVLPPLLARTIMRPFFIKMGFIRFIILVTLLQFMAALPIKMVLRWSFNLKYIVALPEVFFNI